VNNGTVPLNHAYADNGSYVVDVCVTDDDGATACDAVTLTVTNVDPTVAGGPDTSGAEGSPVNVAAAVFHDDGTADTHTATVSWGDGTSDTGTVAESPFGPPGSTTGNSGTAAFGSHTYADNGTYTITVCVSDDDGGQGCDTVVATIGNVSPTSAMTNVGDGPAFFLPLVDVSLGATLHDAGTLDSHSASVNWGDGALTDATVTESPFGPPGSTSGLNGTATSSHAYASAGTYSVYVSVRDDDGGAAPTLSATVEVVSPEVALTLVLPQLRALANDPAISSTARAYLVTAVKTIDGASTPGPPNSGALQKLRDGDLAAALVKIRDALKALDQAKAAQPALELNLAQLVLTQIAESIAAQVLMDVVTANTPPTAAEAKQIAKLQQNLLLGRTRRAANQWVSAVDAFHSVVKNGVAML
jgi:PKD repeat protein